MDITNYVTALREQGLTYGDHASYRAQLTKKLRSCRKKLSVQTKSRGKFNPKREISAEQIGGNHEFVHLLLLSAERDWAMAMVMKNLQSAESRRMKSHERSHIVNALRKATRKLNKLVELLSDSASGAGTKDILEAKALAAYCSAASYFEKRAWEPALQQYSIPRMIYTVLFPKSSNSLTESIDIAIKYSAHKLDLARTLSIPVIARRFFPRSDEALTAQVSQLDSKFLDTPGDATDQSKSSDLPKTITWRSRSVPIEDAGIAIALAAVETAKSQLVARIESMTRSSAKEKAEAYDELLIASQNAADAAKDAVEEMKEDGIPQSDPRMQNLQITRTAVNYEMLSWRIGRNRVLTGEKDGVSMVLEVDPRKRKQRAALQKEERPSRYLVRIKEKAKLYDDTLQSIDSMKDLPGVAADESLVASLQAKHSYFAALRCLVLSRAHTLIEAYPNALALVKRAHDQSREASSNLENESVTPHETLQNADVSLAQGSALGNTLRGELQRSRALAQLAKAKKQSTVDASAEYRVALSDRLSEYPEGGVDLSKIVTYPPKIEAIPIKPIFLDVAWNHIQYALEGTPAASSKVSEKTMMQRDTEAEKPAKKGWFGFGR